MNFSCILICTTWFNACESTCYKFAVVAFVVAQRISLQSAASKCFAFYEDYNGDNDFAWVVRRQAKRRWKAGKTATIKTLIACMTLVHRPQSSMEEQVVCKTWSMKNQNNLPEFDLNRVFFTMQRWSAEFQNLFTIDKMSIKDVINRSLRSEKRLSQTSKQR